MRDSFTNLVDKLNTFSELFEQILENLPNSARNYKLKTKSSAAYKAVSRALSRHDMLVTDSVPKLKVKLDDMSNEFIDTWNIYNDYMVEQHGIRMGSRMQKYRLELLIKYTERNLVTATSWLKFYMATGSQNIFPVNEIKTELNGKEKLSAKAGFTLPSEVANGNN